MKSAASLVLLLMLTAASQAGLPSYDATWKFCAELQGDYAKRQAAALTDRLDKDRMFVQMTTPLGPDALKDPAAKAGWEKNFLPIARSELEYLSSYKTLSVEQVGLLEGQRVAVCILFQPHGAVNTLTLWLDQRPDGSLGIVDYRTMGQQLEITRRLRQFVLLLSGVFNSALDEEERTLSFASGYAVNLQAYFRELNVNKLDAAFDRLTCFPPEVRATRLWQDLRDGLALAGSATARKSAFEDARISGTLNPLLALGKPGGDQAQVLAALDLLDRRTLHSAYVRGVRAEYLVTQGRAAEGLALARATYELNPFSATACAAAVRAAAVLARTDDALHALRAWNRVAAPAEIDAQLAPGPDFTRLRETPQYRAWLAAAPTKASATP
jgi:hypothetical protein